MKNEPLSSGGSITQTFERYEFKNWAPLARLERGMKRSTIEGHRALQNRVSADGTLDPTVLLAADRLAIELEHKRLEVQLDYARTLVDLEGIAGPP